MTDDTIGLKQARELFDTALRLTENCHESFLNGSPESVRLRLGSRWLLTHPLAFSPRWSGGALTGPQNRL